MGDPLHRENELGQPVGLPVTDWAQPEFPAGNTLTGRFCQLVSLEPGLHSQELFAANALNKNGSNWTYLPYGPLGDAGEYRAWLNSVAAGTDPLFYTVLIGGEDVGGLDLPAGVASYLRIDPSNGSIEVGHIHFSPRMQQSPAATEAMFLMMQHAFDLGYRRYEWKCDSLNAPSCAAAERLGFSFEGIFRQATVYKGRNRDTAWYSVIDSEWPRLKKVFEMWLAPDNFDADGTQRQSLREMTRPLLRSNRV